MTKAEQLLEAEQKHYEFQQYCRERNAERRVNGRDEIIHRPTLACRKTWGGWVIGAVIALAFVIAAFSLAGDAQ